jgi:hypothetical protein
MYNFLDSWKKVMGLQSARVSSFSDICKEYERDKMDFFEFHCPQLGSQCITTEAVSLEILQLNNEIYRSKMQASLLDTVT